MFENKLFGIEHALSMYASSFAILPAASIYNEQELKNIRSVIDKCHIYLIGRVPRVNVAGARQDKNKLIVSISVLGKVYELDWHLGPGFKLQYDNEFFYLKNTEGKRSFPSDRNVRARLRAAGAPVNFDVQYIGQAYGEDGSRNALDRLKKHETLQKISVQGIPERYRLELSLLEVVPGTRMITLFNPRAENKETNTSRIKAGVDKLFGTSEKERISLYEAALIRHFRPIFNVKFKDSFPSTNMELLKGCYEKDFSAVIAEIIFDEFPYFLFSEQVKPRFRHIITHDLHSDEQRKVFFNPAA